MVKWPWPHCFLLILPLTVDLPAVAKLCKLKGHNALAPRRFCNIHGVFIHTKNHVYYPLKSGIRKRRGRNGVKRLWDARKLPLRCDSDVMAELQQVAEAKGSGTKKDVDKLNKQFGYKSSTLSPLIERMNHIKPFQSFPVDSMHLPYANIAPNVVSLWPGDDIGSKDVAYFTDATSFRLVNSCLKAAGKYRFIRPQPKEP